MAEYIIFRGKRVCPCTRDAIVAYEKALGTTLTITQGSYSNAVAASAGSHSRGAVWDGVPLSSKSVLIGRKMGIGVCNRHKSQGFSSNHSHNFVLGDKHQNSFIAYQERELRAGRNGLAGRGKDTDPRPSKWITFAQWQKAQYTAANAKADGKTLLIAGKYYKPIPSVGVKWVNRSRTLKSFSRHTYFVVAWLKKLGYYKSVNDAKWGPVAQAAYDKFRSKHMGLKGSEATGPVGIKSLTALAKAAGSSMPVTEK